MALSEQVLKRGQWNKMYLEYGLCVMGEKTISKGLQLFTFIDVKILENVHSCVHARTSRRIMTYVILVILVAKYQNRVKLFKSFFYVKCPPEVFQRHLKQTVLFEVVLQAFLSFAKIFKTHVHLIYEPCGNTFWQDIFILCLYILVAEGQS